MTGFTPPPRRELPPEVRDRLRRRLWRELDAPSKTRFDRARLSVAAAIGVTVIAACAVIFAQTVPATTPETMAVGRPGPVAAEQMAGAEQANAELDRCYQAASSTGQHVPDRPQWTVSFMKETAGVSVTAARADGKPLFCESTLTSVTVSDPYAEPAYATGSATGALFATPNGTIAGVVDPTWQRFEVRATNGSSLAISEPEASDGLFVMYTSIAAGPDLQLHAQQLPANSTDRPADDDPLFPVREMPPVVEPLASIMDRPVPPPDRVSPRGQALQQCMSRTSDPVPDLDSWQPGAAAVINGDELIMAANARGVATCQWQPYKTSQTDGPDNDQLFRPYIPLTREPQYVDAQQFIVPTSGDAGLVIAGTVRPDATRMTVILDGKVELDTDVRAGTFLSVVPDSLVEESGALPRQRLDEMMTVIYDAKGNTLYNGLLSPR